MIDYITVIYKNYDLLDLQIYNLTKRLSKGSYRLLVVDNTPNSLKKSIKPAEDVVYLPYDNPFVQEFDGISHGRALDFGVSQTSSDIIAILDSDFFILHNDIHTYVQDRFTSGYQAVGAEYNDGNDTKVWVSKNPGYFENIPCCFGSYYNRALAAADTWIVTPDDCNRGMQDGFVEVGAKIRKHIIANKIKTLNWKTTATQYGNCFFTNDANEVMGFHYVAGSHRRWSSSSKDELKSIIDCY